jgi:transcriptional regulator with XRE-family HTH domain
MEIGDRIKERREFEGLTQKELGTLINKSPQVISNWERGYTSAIAHDDILKLSAALNIDLNYLLGRTDDPTPPSTKQDKPTHDEYVLSAKTLPDGLARVSEVAMVNDLDFDEAKRLSDIVFKMFGIPKPVKTDKAAHNENSRPGTGVFDKHDEGDDKDENKK